MEFKLVLKALAKFGYPNKKILSIFDSLGYDSDLFLQDLINNLGHEKTIEFIENTFQKLNVDGKGIKIPLWEKGEYVYMIIQNINVSDDESDECVFIDWVWGDSKIMDDMGRMSTLNDIEDENDPWDLNEFYDQLKQKCSEYIHELTGLYICWGT